ncbi:Zinc finger RING/FYVE/PHD-type protein [Dioscorea alata]|uniref:Zinc finger RING/FYVE/PHD-type protein n=1 Tax=Dioscorea alata TaxID=55571 RepID=A0ACB7W0X7_DIOAL|nr:Zinc finger RING/FYVE/PHD-type protein [Dioscorea alata]
MEAGQCSGAKEEHCPWAKLVPLIPGYQEVQISSENPVVCSQTALSSVEKLPWCEINWDSGRGLATITNTSLAAILVDGAILEVSEELDIESGIEIVSGPKLEGYLSYTFQVIFTEDPDSRNLKISLDVELAKCSICLNIWHDVVTVSPCFHNFCNGCFSEWLRRGSCRPRMIPNHIACPQCRAVVHSVGRNHFLHNIEEAILQTFSSLKRPAEEVQLLDSHASIKSNLVVGSEKKTSRKRPLSLSEDDINGIDVPCPQCGTELAGFRCNRNTLHLQCHGCGGMMPSRPDIGIPQRCLGCDRAFCGAYWVAQGLDASEFGIICPHETFKPVVDHSILRIPDSAHNNNRYERDVTEKCIQHTGKTFQAVISEWIMKFVNKEIDRSMLQLNHAEMISERTHLCRGCYDKLVDYLLYWFRVSLPRHLLPPDALVREDCWYGFSCRTQHHSDEHARRRNHVCRPTRGSINP